MVNLKSLIAGAGLSVMLASGAQAFTPAGEQILRPKGAPKSTPTWMEFTADRGDTLYGACTSFLVIAGLADQYGWADCAGVVVKLNGQEKFLPGFKLREDSSYFLPVVVNDAGQVVGGPEKASTPQVTQVQMQADLARLSEIVSGNLPAFAEAIRGNTAAISEQSARIDEQSAKVDDHARSIDQLADWAESNTQAVEENASKLSAAERAIAAAEAAAANRAAELERWQQTDAELEADQNANIASALTEARTAQATADAAKVESAAALSAAGDVSERLLALQDRLFDAEGKLIVPVVDVRALLEAEGLMKDGQWVVDLTDNPEINTLSGRLDGLEGQVTTANETAKRSNWALVAAAAAALLALIGIAIAMLKQRTLPGRVAVVEQKQAETHAELFPVSFDEATVSVEELQKLVVGDDSSFITLPVTRNETGEVYQLRIERIADNLFRLHGVSRGAGQSVAAECSAQKVIKTIRKAGRDERLTQATPAIRAAAA